MNKLNLSIYKALIVTALLCISPFNLIAYLSPFIFILIILFYVRSSQILRNIIISLFFIFNILFFYKFIDNDFVFGNGLLTIITYGSFLPLIVIPNYFFNNKFLFKKIIIISAPIIIL